MVETESLKIPIEDRERGVRYVFSQNQRYFKYFIVSNSEENDSPVGSFLIQPEWSDWRGKWVVWLHSVYVEKPYRGKSVFKEIQDFLETLLRADSNVIGMRLYVERGNLRAKKAYLKTNYDDGHYDLFEKMFYS